MEVVRVSQSSGLTDLHAERPTTTLLIYTLHARTPCICSHIDYAPTSQ